MDTLILIVFGIILLDIFFDFGKIYVRYKIPRIVKIQNKIVNNYAITGKKRFLPSGLMIIVFICVYLMINNGFLRLSFFSLLVSGCFIIYSVYSVYKNLCYSNQKIILKESSIIITDIRGEVVHLPVSEIKLIKFLRLTSETSTMGLRFLNFGTWWREYFPRIFIYDKNEAEHIIAMPLELQDYLIMHRYFFLKGTSIDDSYYKEMQLQ